MLGHSPLLAALLSLFVSATQAQVRPGPTYFLRRPASAGPPYSLAVLPGSRPLLPPVALGPTGWAVLAYSTLPGSASRSHQSLPLAPLPLPAPRAVAEVPPPYDLYQNLPEDFRRHTLPAVWAEPLPLQLLRSALRR